MAGNSVTDHLDQFPEKRTAEDRIKELERTQGELLRRIKKLENTVGPIDQRTMSLTRIGVQIANMN